ncbi:MAG: helix-turn-helix domain-containing protein [Phenylobacterium sp.]|nr:helix-turn-helix domain-containing protein [Phenylobacterium sp.]
MSRLARNRAHRWHREEIKARVRILGETLSSLARKNGLQEDACRDALRTRRPEAEAVIAKFIGVPAEELWPERYGPGPSTNVDSSTPVSAHRQNVGVA